MSSLSLTLNDNIMISKKEAKKLKQQELEEMRYRQSLEIKRRYREIRKNAVMKSKFGFRVKIDDETISQLYAIIVNLPNDKIKIQYKDYDDQFHLMNKKDLNALKKEIHKKIKEIRKYKENQLRRIKDAKTLKTLKSIEWNLIIE